MATLREIFQYVLGGIHLLLIQHFEVYLRKDENYFRKMYDSKSLLLTSSC